MSTPAPAPADSPANRDRSDDQAADDRDSAREPVAPDAGGAGKGKDGRLGESVDGPVNADAVADKEWGGGLPVLEARGVWRTYDRGDVVALRDVSLSIRSGEFVVIMGPSGSGKSTLLHLLGTLDHPTKGQIRIKGENVARVRALHMLRARSLGFIFQLHNLIPSLTLLDNVMVPMVPVRMPSAEKRKRAVEALEQVGLGHRIHHTPGKVSGGERQRVAFARALVNRPAIILADEPTGSVDSATGENLLKLLQDQKRQYGTTLVVVTHNPEIATEADRVLIIRDGRLTEFPRDKIAATFTPQSNPFMIEG